MKPKTPIEIKEPQSRCSGLVQVDVPTCTSREESYGDRLDNGKRIEYRLMHYTELRRGDMFKMAKEMLKPFIFIEFGDEFAQRFSIYYLNVAGCLTWRYFEGFRYVYKGFEI